ncbi:tRNA (adenosine(37)-N6)-threonylcarbamoyltransferase complex transferase subunit TsaD [Patescibacteria group bacterium]|nr:tRNA (adenosine(37)-N6)-threonylcarbamoyltransferase complex transferase subunit TsaD [Patescibacteria group bacterium]
MRVLGIETSCDETAAAVVEDGIKILSNVVATSAEMHAKTGGIVPEQAARQQVRSIIPIIKESINNAKGIKGFKDIDAIAVTIGPGLIGSLLVGVETAKTLAYFYKKPIIPVNHLVAHIYANWLEQKSNVKSQMSNVPQLPALALVVSGGHTDLVLMRGHGKLTWIGGTRDDAAGEAFDKTARLLGLPYPGGPAISAEAEKYLKVNRVNQKIKLTKFPRPMIKEDNFDWSFSGLKTAVLREAESNPTTLKLRRAELATQVQEAIVDVLVEKCIKAIKKYKPKSFLLAGGVAANKRLRENFVVRIKDEILQVIFHVPPAKLCTDNATYIASYAYFNYEPVDWRKIKANPQLTIVGEV